MIWAQIWRRGQFRGTFSFSSEAFFQRCQQYIVDHDLDMQIVRTS